MPNLQQNPSWNLDQLTLYQAANSNPEAIKRNFLIRIAEFERIVSGLRSKKPGDPLQHELILGRRGSGKSTLLRRIQIEVDEDAELSKRFIAINLAEEQASIYRLSDLWFEVLQELMLRLNSPARLRKFDDFEDNQAYTRYLYTEIHQLIQVSGMRMVLLLDNLDRILQNFDDDGHLLRETLLNYDDMQIIGGSTRMDEQFWQYDKPFYEFFRRHRLEGLNFEEIHQLLNHWSTAMNLPLLHDYALHFRGRMETIRILTDGSPRALQFFIQVLLHDSGAYGFDYLRKVMDRATPLYQERLNNLTPPQRKIVQEMAFWRESVPTKILVEKCRMESKLIASYLKQLEQYGIVDTIATGKKNHLYRISERFFNMWLIVTQGNLDQKRKAKYLTLFLESWYDGEELKVLTKQYLGGFQDGLVSYDKAMEGFAPSKFMEVQDRDEPIAYTRKNEMAGPSVILSEEAKPNSVRMSHQLILEIGNGNFEHMNEKIELVLQTNQQEDMTWFLTNLLYLEQTQLVRSLFESEQHGQMLQDRYEPLYYATRILIHKTEDNLLLKIPPEVLPTVQEIVEKVKGKHLLYSKKQ